MLSFALPPPTDALGRFSIGHASPPCQHGFADPRSLNGEDADRPVAAASQRQRRHLLSAPLTAFPQLVRAVRDAEAHFDLAFRAL
jgi:hypothetical protein